MTYWLTTHYPHLHPDHPWHVYLKDQFRHLADRVSIGDRVAFYELKGSGKGQEAIVRISSVTAPCRANQFRDNSKEEGDQIWQWEIPCMSEGRLGYVPKERLYEILNWPLTRRPRIAGGLLELETECFQAIEKDYLDLAEPPTCQADLVKYLGTSTTFMTPAELMRMRNQDANKYT